MTVRPAALALALLAASTALLPAEPPPAAGREGSPYEILYFGRGGPAHFRLHVLLDGRPADAVYAEAVEALFAFCDRNGDGELDAAEQAVLAPPRRGREREAVIASRPTPQPLRLTFPSRSGKVTRADFAVALREAGYGPVVLKLVAARSDSEQLSSALFRYLDQDGDGKLSPGELRAARERLAFLDVNEDELITAAELLGRAVGAQPNARPATAAEARDSAPDLRMLAGDATSITKQLLMASGSGRPPALRPADLGMDTKAFALLDKNGDGRLDAAELEQWLCQPPDAELTLSCGLGEVSLLQHQANRVRSRLAGDATELLLARAQFRFEAPEKDRARLPARATDVQDRLKKLADAQGVVARKQVTEQPDLAVFFDFADRNGDGRLDEAEATAALAVLDRLVSCRATITVRDLGNGLFELLDRNGDGQLSPRELVEAAAVIKPYADARDQVSPEDLPRRFIVHVAADSIPVVFPAAAVSATLAGTRTRPAVSQVPTWFLQMDRNGDGDVSLRECLGPLELFRRLDRDGDGLISPQEAREVGSPTRMAPPK